MITSVGSPGTSSPVPASSSVVRALLSITAFLRGRGSGLRRPKKKRWPERGSGLTPSLPPLPSSGAPFEIPSSNGGRWGVPRVETKKNSWLAASELPHPPPPPTPEQGTLGSKKGIGFDVQAEDGVRAAAWVQRGKGREPTTNPLLPSRPTGIYDNPRPIKEARILDPGYLRSLEMPFQIKGHPKKPLALVGGTCALAKKPNKSQIEG